MRLREALEQAPLVLLRRMAAEHGVVVQATGTHAELVERLHERLQAPGYLAGEVARLEPAERAVLAGAGEVGGELRGFLLARLVGSDEPAAWQRLLDRGLLFRTFAPLGPHRGEVFTVPEEVLALAPAAGSQPHAPLLPAAVTPPPREQWRASDPLFSLFALLSCLRRHQGRSGRKGSDRLTELRREVEGWAHEPGGWAWHERWDFLRHLALVVGLLERRPDESQRLAAGSASHLSDRPRLLQRLWRAFLSDREWSELVRAQVPLAQELSGRLDHPSVRAAVLDAVGALAPGTWHRVDDLIGWLEHTRPMFLRGQLDARAAALVDPSTGRRVLGEGSWDRVEGPMLRYLLLGPLYWLGCLGADAEGQRFALTSTGAALLRGEVAPAARPSQSCLWESGRRLLAPARSDLGTLLRAERYLLLEMRGQPSRYLLEREGLAGALVGGGSISECRRLLEALTQSPLPGEVTAVLEECERGFGAVKIRPAVVLETRTPEELARATGAPGVGELIRSRLGDTTAEVAAPHALEMAERLRRAGMLPRVDAALRLTAGREAYAALVDERVLELLLVSLLAFRVAQPEQLARLEGATGLVERLEELFPDEQLESLRAVARELAGRLEASPRSPRSPSGRPRGSRRAKRS